MEPDVRYCTTEDGVRIAYTVTGSGPPLVWATDLLSSHVQREWRLPVLRDFYSGASSRRTLVRFDGRGLGLSDQDVKDLSLDGRVRDLEAVVDSLRLDEFALVGDGVVGGWMAATYTVGHPESISHLILLDGCVSASALSLRGSNQTLMELFVRDWEMYTENVGSLQFGWADQQARQYGEFIRACITERTAKRSFAALSAVDVSSLLPSISVPTLVLCHPRVPSVEDGKDLAALIPGARLKVIDGGWGDNIQDALAAIDEFLGGGEDEAVGPAPSGLVTILFTDIEGSTSLTQRLGDARAQELVRTHNAIVRDALKAHGGSAIKHTGDGIMAWFPLTSGAVECAIAIQRAFDATNADVGAPLGEGQAAGGAAPGGGGAAAPLRVRIGLNAGEPVAEDEDLFGTAVQLASRICAYAEPGQILASNVVRELAAGKGFVFSAQRESTLKGFAVPVSIFEVRWREGDAGGAQAGASEPSIVLTARESEVLSLLAGGWSAKEIATQLRVSLSTVQRHIANIYAKIGARGRVEAAAYAIERGLVRSRDA